MSSQEKISGKDRLLELYTQLAEGKGIDKARAAQYYGVTPRSVQRDIDELRRFVAQRNLTRGTEQNIIYDRGQKEYRLVPPFKQLLANEEALAVLKILLESRALKRSELDPIIDKLLECCLPPENQSLVKQIIGNERLNYVELQHGKTLLPLLWQLAAAVKQHLEIAICYRRNEGKIVRRLLRPAGVIFSEFYFYLAAYIVPQRENEALKAAKDSFPTIYRLDRIAEVNVTSRHFQVPYGERFQEEEFRKRVQFMYSGKLQKIAFWYKGANPEAVLDRLPTAQILKSEAERCLITAEVFGGKGVNMWLASQGKRIEVLSGDALRKALGNK